VILRKGGEGGASPCIASKHSVEEGGGSKKIEIGGKGRNLVWYMGWFHPWVFKPFFSEGPGGDVKESGIRLVASRFSSRGSQKEKGISCLCRDHFKVT